MKQRKVYILLTAIICCALTFNLAFASEPDVKTEEIYHVYASGKYIGVVSDQEKIEQLVEKKEQQASKKYEELEVTAGTNLEVVAEQVFSYEQDEKAVLKEVEKAIKVQAVANAVVVDGVKLGYVKDEETFEEVEQQLKLLFVEESDLQAIENNTETKLAKNELQVKNVTIEQQLTTEEVNVAPAKVVEPKTIAKRLVEGGTVTKNYPIQEGDTIASVAKSYGVTVKDILNWNESLTKDSALQSGKTLKIEVVRPYVDVVVNYELLKVKAIGYEKIKKEDSSLLIGKTKVQQKGKKGKKEIVYSVKKVNGEVESKAAVSAQVTAEPVDQIKLVGTKEIPNVGTGTFTWPAVGGYVSSQKGQRWGRSHDGIDIARPSNFTIKAADNGVVTFTGPDGTYGNKVTIEHNNGYQTVYGHLASISVSVGQTVGKGDKIGIMGSTGRSTGIHLHFEVRKNGTLINPLTVVQQ